MGCYHDSAVHGIQLIRMDQYTEAADRAGMVRICLLCIPDETVFNGNSKDFEEAARIDGANQFQIYWKIFMPIMKPSLILVGVLNMLTVWNDYLGPLIFLQDRSKYTLALGLASFKGVHSTQIIPMLCITIIMIIPPIIIFIIAQKYIVEGTSGSIK